MSERVTVSFTRAEYEAALKYLRTTDTWQRRDHMGAPTVDTLDLQDALQRMERADRPLKIVS